MKISNRQQSFRVVFRRDTWSYEAVSEEKLHQEYLDVLEFESDEERLWGVIDELMPDPSATPATEADQAPVFLVDIEKQGWFSGSASMSLELNGSRRALLGWLHDLSSRAESVRRRGSVLVFDVGGVSAEVSEESGFIEAVEFGRLRRRRVFLEELRVGDAIDSADFEHPALVASAESGRQLVRGALGFTRSRFFSRIEGFLAHSEGGEAAAGILQRALRAYHDFAIPRWWDPDAFPLTYEGGWPPREVWAYLEGLSLADLSGLDETSRAWVAELEEQVLSHAFALLAAEWYRRGAEQGRAEAQVGLGSMYAYGRGVEQDDAQAVAWYRKAAEQGDVRGQTNLGEMYVHGRGVEQDDVQAVAWYRKAAEQGEIQAQGKLGWLYLHGRGVEQDDAQAVAWYHKAAEQGDVRAQTDLGSMYAYGRGVEQDDAQAVAWYRKAAEQGYVLAQTNLGEKYEHGRGVEQDDAQAVAWYRKAAEQGDVRAQTNLGWMYEHGRGVEQDDAQALAWYRKAAEQGDTAARTSLEWLYQRVGGSSTEN